MMFVRAVVETPTSGWRSVCARLVATGNEPGGTQALAA